MKKKLLKQPLFYTNIVLLLLFLFFILGMSGKISFANSIIQQLVGGGTQNSVAAFNSSNSLTNSQIYDNGTNVGIGTTNPSSKLDVNGYGQFISPDNGSTGGVRIVAPSNNSQGFIQFTNNARSSEWADISADQGGNLFLRPAGNGNLWANNSITASGNVYGNDICTFGGKCLSQGSNLGQNNCYWTGGVGGRGGDYSGLGNTQYCSPGYYVAGIGAYDNGEDGSMVAPGVLCCHP